MQHSQGIPTGAETAGVDRMPPWARQTVPGVASKWIVAVLRRVRWTEEAPSAAWTGVGARPGKPVTAEIKACPLREAVAAVEAAEAVAAVEAVGAEEAVEAAAAGNLPGTTHPLSKGGKSHGAIHQYQEKRFMV